MKEKKIPSSITWRVKGYDDEDQQILNQWVAHQSNIQMSITNIILHTVKRLGYTDVMAFKTQEMLYQEEQILHLVERLLKENEITKQSIEQEVIQDAVIPSINRDVPDADEVHPEVEPMQAEATTAPTTNAYSTQNLGEETTPKRIVKYPNINTDSW